MDRRISIERVYNLGNYNMLRVTDEISGLPEDLMLNEQLVGRFRYLQILNAEHTYYMHQGTMTQLDEQVENGNYIALIKEKKNSTLEEIKSILEKENHNA